MLLELFKKMRHKRKIGLIAILFASYYIVMGLFSNQSGDFKKTKAPKRSAASVKLESAPLSVAQEKSAPITPVELSEPIKDESIDTNVAKAKEMVLSPCVDLSKRSPLDQRELIKSGAICIPKDLSCMICFEEGDENCYKQSRQELDQMYYNHFGRRVSDLSSDEKEAREIALKEWTEEESLFIKDYGRQKGLSVFQEKIRQENPPSNVYCLARKTDCDPSLGMIIDIDDSNNKYISELIEKFNQRKIKEFDEACENYKKEQPSPVDN